MIKPTEEETMGLKIGDVVQLKSGGPNMTITAIEKLSEDFDVEVYVTWFFRKTSNNELIEENGNFHPATLRKVDNEE